MSPNLQAFLDMLARCEGTDGADGYRALFGYTPTNGRIFDNGYIDHPGIKFPFTQTDGATNYSTAAGRYQIIKPTWLELKSALGLVAFTPADQDAAAIELIRRCGALPDIEAGDLQAAIDKCAGIWASLPASHYPQPKRTYAFAEKAFADAGGAIA
jgi:muramidase (phage lysozyme)